MGGRGGGASRRRAGGHSRTIGKNGDVFVREDSTGKEPSPGSVAPIRKPF